MRRRSLLPSLVAAVAGAALAVPAVPAVAQAEIRVIDPVRGFRRQLAAIKRSTDVPVLWPDRVAIDVPRRQGIEAKWTAGRAGWELSLGIGPLCGGANACFVGELSARRGARPTLRRRVRLHGGVRGWYKPSTCGASCSPAEVQWRQGGILYDIQFREAGPGRDRAKLIALADSAIAAGPR